MSCFNNRNFEDGFFSNLCWALGFVRKNRESMWRIKWVSKYQQPLGSYVILFKPHFTSIYTNLFCLVNSLKFNRFDTFPPIQEAEKVPKMAANSESKTESTNGEQVKSEPKFTHRSLLQSDALYQVCIIYSLLGYGYWSNMLKSIKRTGLIIWVFVL